MAGQRRGVVAAFVYAAFALAACVELEDPDATFDAGLEEEVDSSMDSGVDARSDGDPGNDAGVDADGGSTPDAGTGDGSEEPDAGLDGGQDASVDADAGSGDSGVDSSIRCGTDVCGVGEECCLTFTPGPERECVSVGTCEGIRRQCDDPSDCPGGVCCSPDNDFATRCVDTCEGLVVCATADDCGDGAQCCTVFGVSYCTEQCGPS